MSGSATFRPDVEGLRAIAVVLVLLYHAAVPGFRGGYVGVDVFFVISGFLITGLLLRELDSTGRLSLSNFYARRARRLLPAAVLTLVVILIGSVLLFSPIRISNVAGDVASAAIYLSNMRFGVQANDYFAAESAVSPVLHFWSLSVEEQYYIIWPAVMLLLFRFSGGRTRGLFLGLAVLAGASLAAALLLTPVNQPWAFYLLPTRAWELGAGALIAIAATRLGSLPSGARTPLVLVGLAMITIAAVTFTETTAFPGPAALLPVTGTALVIIAGLTTQPSALSRWLGVAPMQFLGRTSYSVYLWHWPMLVFAAAVWGGTLPLAMSLLIALLSIPLAAVTQRLVEDPLRYGRLIGTRVRLNLGQAVASSLAVVVACGAVVALVQINTPVTLAALEPAFDEMKPYKKAWCSPAAEVENYADCNFANKDSDHSIVLFGDSHARSWFAAAQEAALEHDWKLVSLAKAACPSAHVLAESPKHATWDPECVAWRTAAIRRIKDTRPDVVVLTNRPRWGYFIKGEFVSDQAAVRAEWERGLSKTVEAIKDSVGRVVILGDTPIVKWDVPACLSANPNHFAACAVPATQIPRAIHRVERSVARATGAEFIDPTPWLCGDKVCPMVVGNTIVYRDGQHLTEPYSAKLGPRLGKALRLGKESVGADETAEAVAPSAEAVAPEGSVTPESSALPEGSVTPGGTTEADAAIEPDASDAPTALDGPDASVDPQETVEPR